MPIPAKRNALDFANFTNKGANLDHPGLALTRYLFQHGDNHEAAKRLLDRMQDSGVPSQTYKNALTLWKTAQQTRQAMWQTQKMPNVCRLFTGTLASPLAVGLGNESTLEVGLTLHHTYGMPMIPGSALKGMCRRGLEQWRQNSDAGKAMSQEGYDALKLALFGALESVSEFVFWDAWHVPDTKNESPFHRDTITVHHPAYYGSHGKEAWPTDFDDPTPVPFLVARPGAQFLFALDAPTPDWGEFALNLLQWSLAHVGIGGKTNAGYGYFDPKRWILPPRIETWADCQVTRQTRNQRLEIRIGEPPRQIVRSESEWVRGQYASGWSGSQTAAFNAGKLRVDAEVEMDGNNVTLLKLTPRS